MTACHPSQLNKLTALQLRILLRIVADGCGELMCWGSSCTDLAFWGEVFPSALLAPALQELLAMGLIAEANANLNALALYRPTVAGVRLVVRWLQEFLAYPPREACAHE